MEVLAAKKSRAVLELVNVADVGERRSAAVLDNPAERKSVSLSRRYTCNIKTQGIKQR